MQAAAGGGRKNLYWPHAFLLNPAEQLWDIMFHSLTLQELSVGYDQKNITAESGQNIVLTCRAPKNNIILGVEWNRADLRDEYVLFYRNEQFDPDNQHPSFKNRVDLQDSQMKDGDVSLILKNVSINDTGTYECRVAGKTAKRDI
ncbi:butyrophilin-like protein 8 [Haplochromis burtoni]|uniref:butyrophilin-like protein 8 n=1 Tax=Haplochromis burtoni TaxID=8153 RepID=UPI001C2CE359|nr:butyrophilin-like protein 8 [Haplochromis burtoni]